MRSGERLRHSTLKRKRRSGRRGRKREDAAENQNKGTRTKKKANIAIARPGGKEANSLASCHELKGDEKKTPE